MIFVVFLITLFYVALKVFQQRNVTLDHHKTIVPVSILMGVCEYTGVGIAGMTAANDGILAATFLGIGAGTGGAIGCYIAIYLHKKVHNAQKRPTT